VRDLSGPHDLPGVAVGRLNLRGTNPSTASHRASHCDASRVENGHTVPAIETLEKLARALECPLYQLFYEGEEPPKLPSLFKRKSPDDIAWGSAGKDSRYLGKLRRLLGKTEEGNRKLIFYMAQKMANR
jgi:transcriptional regulator with XRE-family HTH domain